MDNRKLESWYEEYSQDIFNFLVYYNQTDDVDDLLQEVFFKAWKKSCTFKGNSSPKTWLYSIARRVSIDNFRKQKLKNLFRLQENLEHVDTPEKRLMDKEEIIELHNAIKSLKRSYREVVICRGILELSINETAEILQWSNEKVNTTYHRAKLKLGEILTFQGRMSDEAAR
ncbi:RNA polymerase sigma factor [Halobacillus karajensis]|uniref:RNA polymerase sigma factor SigX n=1 Tax=Halobacillus karajensis TaxID=195088 RepID=A0A059NW37_9BACI|nr:RNA polymerase sigma factor [Halobacillus karajensis]CDQ20333.1 RNA polymerase sigma factor SigX [Halobacillus karajensis]CDQ23599.1 RNA polymerase sigma factor SigX [Halobacillus karajensis]CDQ27078.1 RNA polymerase sigma factor SigX [Halobacillus karajensis]